MKVNHRLVAALAAVIAWQLYTVWIRPCPSACIYSIVYGTQEKPFVYRALVPWISKTLSAGLGLDPRLALGIVFIASAVGMYYSIRYLYRAFSPDPFGDLGALIGSAAVMMVSLFYLQPYDFMTVSFFGFCLGALARRKYWLYFLLFPIATINRETTFLLIGFYMVYYVSREISAREYVEGLVYQAAAFSIIRFLIMDRYADNPGAAFWPMWKEVIPGYIDGGIQSAILAGFVLALLYLMFRKWTDRPEFLRVTFWAMVPALALLHVLVGHSFELRNFSEAVPVLVCLVTYPFPHRASAPAVVSVDRNLPFPREN